MNHDKSEIVGLLASVDVAQNEAETYVALLHIDSVSIRKIAAYTGINRGTTYEALKKLIAIGLVSVKQNGKREQYTAESPEKIYDIIRDKRRDLLDASTIAKKVVPNLLAQKASTSGRPVVRYYEDHEGVALILTLSALAYRCPNYSITLILLVRYGNIYTLNIRNLPNGVSPKISTSKSSPLARAARLPRSQSGAGCPTLLRAAFLATPSSTITSWRSFPSPVMEHRMVSS